MNTSDYGRSLTLCARVLTISVILVAMACAKPVTPVDPIWGKQPCSHCTMIVDDRRYAGEAIDDAGRHFFDDIGCMVLWAEQNKTARIFIRDQQSNKWVDAKIAHYAKGARTPMGYGFEARRNGGYTFLKMRESVLSKEGLP